MGGTKAGFQKARQTMINKKFNGDEQAYIEWCRQRGARGGQNGNTGGFASQIIGSDGLTGKQRAEVAGAIGGKKSKRTKRQ